MSPDLCDHGIMGGRAWGRCETCATPEKRAEWVARQAATCEHGLGKATCERCAILALTAEAASLRATIEEQRQRIDSLEAKNALTAASWRKAEDALTQAESEREALREALESVLVNGPDGTPHAPDCIGVEGYECKPWCSDIRRTLARNPEGPKKPEPCAYCEEDDCPTPIKPEGPK